MISQKTKSSEKIAPNKYDKIIKTEKGTAKVLNTFFSNIVQKLHIQDYNVDDPGCENINNPPLKAIARYGNHPSIVAIKQIYNSKSHFLFKKMLKKKKFVKK